MTGPLAPTRLPLLRGPAVQPQPPQPLLARPREQPAPGRELAGTAAAAAVEEAAPQMPHPARRPARLQPAHSGKRRGQ